MLPDEQLTTHLQQLYAPLNRLPMSRFGDYSHDKDYERIARRLQAVCFEEPGIGNPQYADPAELRPAQLAPGRQFWRWAVEELAATDWTDAKAARRAWVFWRQLMDCWAFSSWGLPQLMPDLEPRLAPVLAQLLAGPNHPLGPDVRLGHLLEHLLGTQLRQNQPEHEALLQLVPAMLRFENCSNQILTPLTEHPNAQEEIPRFLHLIFTQPQAASYFAEYSANGTGYADYRRRVGSDVLDQPHAVKLLPAMLPTLRTCLRQWSQPQLAELAQELELQHLANGGSFNEALEKFAASPNRRLWLSLLAELATEPALGHLVAQAQAQVQQRAGQLAREKQAKKAARESAKALSAGQLPDFNLKLLVVRELLLQGVELPGLAKVLARPRNDADYSYEPLKSAVAAYRKLHLTQEHYDLVETLEPDGGDIWDLNIINNWDGSDGQFDIQSLEGIGLLLNLRQFNPISLLAVDDFSPLLDCPNLEEARITDFVDANSDVVRALEARGVRVL